MRPSFYEFFAGGGMVRAGLGPDWDCLFANDIDQKKCAAYEVNWGKGAMRPGDVNKITLSDLPGEPSLMWASFPCQDLSLAGAGAGLKGDRSGTFWPFWRLLYALAQENRAPPIVALENVAATLTSHKGMDFEALCVALCDAGYQLGARVIDALSFVPQSRPRMFLIAVRKDIVVPPSMRESSGSLEGVDRAVSVAYRRLQSRSAEEPSLKRVMDRWVNWALPQPCVQRPSLDSIIERIPTNVEWHTPADTATLIARMSELNMRKIEKARHSGRKVFGTAYRRTRVESGIKSVRTEVRFDGIAGCLRTPAGGSSRQIVIEIDGMNTRSRLMTPREGARLMGLLDTYILPDGYNEAYHLVGDGVAVDVVRFLAESIFEPILRLSGGEARKAA